MVFRPGDDTEPIACRKPATSWLSTCWSLGVMFMVGEDVRTIREQRLGVKVTKGSGKKHDKYVLGSYGPLCNAQWGSQIVRTQ